VMAPPLNWLAPMRPAADRRRAFSRCIGTRACRRKKLPESRRPRSPDRDRDNAVRATARTSTYNDERLQATAPRVPETTARSPSSTSATPDPIEIDTLARDWPGVTESPALIARRDGGRQ
jgi:hypothetical protein